MSKKNDRRKRTLEKEKTTAKAAIITLAVAAVSLVLGIVGLIRNSSRLREYENAEDTRRVEATVTDTKLKNDQALYKNLSLILNHDMTVSSDASLIFI